jgi:hypothetical protein
MQIRKPTAEMKLDFFGIGAQRSATTWLFECLLEHPDIRGADMPANKELNFFNHNYEKGYAWYHKRFKFGPWKTGEYSVLYYFDESVPGRIYRYNPDIKLILSLRNPIDRAFSQHKHEVQRGRIPEGLYGFWDALALNPTYIEQGKYAILLERYLEYFKRRQIHIVLYDDITSKPSDVLRDLYRFIGVDETYAPSSTKTKVNVAHTFRSRGLYNFIFKSSAFVREHLGEQIHYIVKATRIPALIRNYNETEIDKRIVPPLSKDDRRRLHEIFAGEIERLSEIIGRDLSHWK